MTVTSVTPSNSPDSFQTVSSGDGIIVYNGGVTDGAAINSGGYETVSSGGAASYTAVSAGGSMTVSSGGYAFSALVEPTGATQIPVSSAVSSGQTESVYATARYLYVDAGGSAFGTVLEANPGIYTTSDGGTVYEFYVVSETIYSGGAATSETIAGQFATETLSGGSSFNAILNSAGTQILSSGATATSATLGLGGYQYVLSGAVATATTVGFGGQQEVGSSFTIGYTSIGLTAPGSSTANGATAIGTILGSGGTQSVDSGGTAIGTIVESGGGQVIGGGTATNTVVQRGGSQTIFAGGSASSTVLAGGAEYVMSNGYATGTIVGSGATLSVTVNGEADGAVVMSGGTIRAVGTTTKTAIVSGATLSSGTKLFVSGYASGINNVLMSGATETVSRSYASGTVVNVGATEILIGSAAVVGTVLDGGKIVTSQYLNINPKITGLVFNPGGSIDLASPYISGSSAAGNYSSSADSVSVNPATDVLTVKSGTTAIFSAGLTGSYANAVFSLSNDGSNHILITETGLLNAVVASGVTSTIYNGATASNTYVSGGGVLVLSGGSATGTILSGSSFTSYASETIYSGGSATGETITGQYSVETVSSGGLSVKAILNSAGTQILSSGSTATSATLVLGGIQDVLTGAVANSTYVSSGGAQYVGSTTASGGTALYTTAGSGGDQNIQSGGLAVSTTVLSGGGQNIAYSGSLATSAIIQSGGSQTIALHGSANATVLAGGVEYVYSQSVASGTTGSGVISVTGGGTVNNAVVSGGRLAATGIRNGASAIISGASVTGAAVNLSYNGYDVNGLLQSGSTETISSGGVASGVTVYTGAKQVVLGSGTASGTILSGGEIVLSSATGKSAIVSGLVVLSGGSIDISYLAYNAADQVNINSATDILTVVSGATTLYSLTLAGTYTGDYFALSNDGGTGTLYGGPGTLLTETTTPCYCPGTLITTETGDVPVESLAIGDRVLTFSGEMRAIKWIGTRGYNGRFVWNNKKEVLPVCIKAGAIAENSPVRDLWVSPHHAIYLDGLLIEAKDLINGVSIVQSERADQVTYFHIELDSHDVILAEGAWAESFIDDSSRGMFHNAHEYAALYPDEEVAIGRYYAPRLDDGYEVEAARLKIMDRAGIGVDANLAEARAARRA